MQEEARQPSLCRAMKRSIERSYVFSTAFGKKQAFTSPALKSPAQIDGLPEGKAFTTRWAYKPDAGETVVPSGDSRMEVSKDTKAGFAPVKKGKKK